MFELGNLQRFVVHDYRTYEAYVIDPYEVVALVPVLSADGERGSEIWCLASEMRTYRVQECVKSILEGMSLAAPELLG